VETLIVQRQALAGELAVVSARLTALLTHSPVGLLVLDGADRIVLANEAAARGLVVRAADLSGRPLAAVIAAREVQALVAEARERGSGARSLATLGPWERPFQLLAARIEPTGEVLLVLQDLSDLRRLEAVRRDFLANISHELRTPLASLLALVETLEEGALEDPPAAREFLARMRVEVDGLTRLVQELLDLARLESGRETLAIAPVPVVSLAEGAARRLAAQAERAGLRLVLAVPPDLPPVLADRERIERVLINLLHNAIKFTPPGGQVTISACRAGEWVVVAVADTGVGIAPEDLPRIFERFYKADRSRATSGAGLGLAIARQIVLAHGGRIWAESEPGRGSIFRFTLPIGARANPHR
jgi:two-component system phosphate regulon sensor histidine kinase PhoR